MKKIIKYILFLLEKLSLYRPVKIATCVYLIKDGYVLMGNQQKTIFGFKGYGGKVKPGQTIRQNAVEEVWEETGGIPELRINPEEEGGIHIREEWLEPAGLIDFYNGSEGDVPFGKPSFRVYFFICRKSMGKAVDTVEMRDHQLFNVNYLPIDKMIKGDGEFIPKMLNGICLTGWLIRDKDWNTTSSFFEECTKESLNF
jgi:8-oxo-dGTP pyrophosphatase MutT (NUDIX family)